MFAELTSIGRLVLTCNSLRAAGKAATSITDSIILSMSRTEVLSCLDLFGSLAWPASSLSPVWLAVRERAMLGESEQPGPVDARILSQLASLAPAILKQDPDLIDVDTQEIDGLSVLGSFSSLSGTETTELVGAYIAANSKNSSNPLSSHEVCSLGQLLCGLSDDDWASVVSPSSLSLCLPSLSCPLPPTACSILTPLIVPAASAEHTDHSHGSPTWSTSHLSSLGGLASCLPLRHLRQLPPNIMDGLSPSAVANMSPLQIQSLSPEQLSHLSPHAVSLLPESFLPSISVEGRKALGMAGGQVSRVKRAIQQLHQGNSSEELLSDERKPKSLEPEDDGMALNEPEATSEPEAESEPEPETEPDVDVEGEPESEGPESEAEQHQPNSSVQAIKFPLELWLLFLYYVFCVQVRPVYLH